MDEPCNNYLASASIGILGGLSVYLATEDSLGSRCVWWWSVNHLAMAFDGLDGQLLEPRAESPDGRLPRPHF